jgi:NitT/TauT family transport system substrate-binding protein
MPRTSARHSSPDQPPKRVRRGTFAGALAPLLLAPAVLRTAYAQTAPPAMLRLASNAADDVTPLLWAQHTGLFAKAGLNVDIQRFNSGSVVTAAVVGRSVEIGKANLLSLIGARSHGIALQLVAPGELWLTDKPISGMIVLKDGPITGAKDLNGKTLPAGGLHDLLETASRAWVDANGGDSKTLHFIEMSSSIAPQALVDGRIAAATLSTPYLGNALATGKFRVLGRPEDAIAKRFMITGWFASEPTIQQNHDALMRFAQVCQQAAAYTDVHTAETVALTAPFWGIEPDVLAHMNRAYVAGVIDPKDIQPLADAALKYGVIEKPLDVADLISAVALRAR